ncbi:MAG: SDR family oxidoreductase, partial [Holophaga sp.]|nr:SDR family oxidoreductase [Holophaga sp.]
MSLQVLVLGGSGVLGRAVLAQIHHAGVAATFTYFRNRDVADSVQAELGCQGYCTDLRDPDGVPALFVSLERDGRLPDTVIHCAGVAPVAALETISTDAWDQLHAIHGRASLQCAQEMVRCGAKGSLVLVSALDGILPVPAPAHYAASQAALWGLTQALAKEIGPKGILVNMALIGVLEGGISAALDPKLRESYGRHAALG